MIDTTAGYRAALLAPYKTFGCRMELHQGGTRVATLNPVGWEVTVQSGAARQLSATVGSFNNMLPDIEIVGRNRRYNTGTYGAGYYGEQRRTVAAGLLTVAYTQVKVWHRVSVDGGNTWHECPLGVFDVSAEDIDLGAAEDETISFTGYDARRAIDLAGWDRPFKVTAGNAWARAVFVALEARPSLQYYNATTIGFSEETERRWYGIGSDDKSPYAVVQELAALGGRSPFIDAYGRLTAADTSAQQLPSHTFRGGDGGTIFTAGRGHDDEALINTVVAIGDSTKKGPVFQVAQNKTPGDRHSVAAIGKRTKTITASGVTSPAKLQAIADRELQRGRGLLERATIQGACLPFLEEFDTVGFELPQLEAQEDWTLDGYRITSGQDFTTDYSVHRRLTS